MLRAARRARRPAGSRSLKELGDEAVELVFGALANAIRRAREIAEAIEARGGVPTVAPETHPLARVDAVDLRFERSRSRRHGRASLSRCAVVLSAARRVRSRAVWQGRRLLP